MSLKASRACRLKLIHLVHPVQRDMRPRARGRTKIRSDHGIDTRAQEGAGELVEGLVDLDQRQKQTNGGLNGNRPLQEYRDLFINSKE